MNRRRKIKKFKKLLRQYSLEIISVTVSVLIIIRLLVGDFSRILVTNFTYLRPEYTFIIFIIFSVLTFVLVLWIFLQTRRKRLKSTKKLSPFAKTIERSHKIREMSETQVVYTADIKIFTDEIYLPKDVDISNPNIIEYYFNIEEKLGI